MPSNKNRRGAGTGHGLCSTGKRLRRFLRLFVLVFALVGSGAWAAAGAVPQRVVSLAPNVTELVFAIGAGEQLVGRSEYSNYPPEALRLPSVGSYYRPALESIAALRPDLCIAMRDGTPTATIERLEALGIPVLVLDIRTLEDVNAALLHLGKLLGREEMAQQAFRAAIARLEALDARAAALGEGIPPPVILFVLQMSPIIAAGPDTYVGRLVARAGGLNPVVAPVPYPRLGLEEVVRAQPQIILTADMGAVSPPVPGSSDRAATVAREGEAGPSTPGGALAAKVFGRAFTLQDTRGALWQPLRGVPALVTQRVYRVDADIFHRPSLRSLDALELLIDCLHNGARTPSAPSPVPQPEPVSGVQPREARLPGMAPLATRRVS